LRAETGFGFWSYRTKNKSGEALVGTRIYRDGAGNVEVAGKVLEMLGLPGKSIFGRMKSTVG